MLAKYLHIYGLTFKFVSYIHLKGYLLFTEEGKSGSITNCQNILALFYLMGIYKGAGDESLDKLRVYFMTTV